MKYISIGLVLILSTVSQEAIAAKFSFKKITDIFKRKSHEELFDKEFQLEDTGVLNIENINGTIHIKSAADQHRVCVKALKRSPKEEMLAQIKIIDHHAANGHITLKTTYLDETTKGSVDYELIVPTDMALHLSTNRGNILIEQAKGEIWASTEHGNISVHDSKGAVNAVSRKSGSIYISEAQGKVKASAYNGSISMEGTKNTVVARTNRGKINVACADIPENSTVALATKSGHVALTLPNPVHAKIKARTERGHVTCAHEITLKSQKTRLDREAWSLFKKEVEGKLGKGSANILLSANYGNIKILKEQTEA